MRLILHRRVRSDVGAIMDYYRAEHPELAEEFYAELWAFLLETARQPGR